MNRLVLDDLKKYNWARFYNDLYDVAHILRRTDMRMRMVDWRMMYEKYSSMPEEERGWLEKSTLRLLDRDIPKLRERIELLDAGDAAFEDAEEIESLTTMFYESLDRSKNYDTPFGARFSMFRVDMKCLHPNNKIKFKLRNGKYVLGFKPGFMPDELQRHGEWTKVVIAKLYNRWKKAGFEVDPEFFY